MIYYHLCSLVGWVWQLHLSVEGASRVVAGNGLSVVCAIWLAMASVACWIRRFMREVSCGCNSG